MLRRIDLSKFDFPSLPAVHSEEEFRKFVAQLDSEFDLINYERTHLQWAKIWKEPFQADLQNQIDDASALLHTDDNHDTIRTWKDKLSDPFLKRWAEVLDVEYTLAQLDQQPALRQLNNHLSDRYLYWRPKMDGKEISYTRQTWIFRHEPDREIRQDAWVAFDDLGNELKDATRELFQMRNAGAQALGYPTYADLKLQLSHDVDREWLMNMFQQMESVTGDTYEKYLHQQAEKEHLPDIQPWDIQYLMDRDPWPDDKYYPADRMASNLFDCMRTMDIDNEALGIDVRFYDSQAGGQCMTLGPKEIHILTSGSDGMLHYNTCFHEFGHALHSAYYDVPYTLRRESGMFTEGIAMFMERWLHYPTWMRKTGVPDIEIEAYRDNWKLPRIYRHRRLAAMVMAEMAMWEDPTQDMDKAFGESTARYLRAAYQPRPFAAVGRWTYPVQLQSYFIADVIASQTHATLRAQFAPMYGKPDAMEHIRKHYLAPGNSIPWLKKIENCTGKELTYDDLGYDMTHPYPDI
jgi:peptidase M3-like protein